MNDNLILRVRCATHGTKRLQVNQHLLISDLFEKVKEQFDLPESGWKLCKQQNYSDSIEFVNNRKINSLGLKNGDMFYLQIEKANISNDVIDISKSGSLKKIVNVQRMVNNLKKTASNKTVTSQTQPQIKKTVTEDKIDIKLASLDGKIERKRNPQVCRHNENSKCVHCLSLEPYDEEILNKADPPIKFLPFHSYIRKLTSGLDKGKFVNLENLRCHIDPDCNEHAKWPHGICSKCQPSAITLTVQKYRHVDYIQFENRHIMNRFLDGWRENGFQRIGFLYGIYEEHKDIPLAIKAIVKAIYEPPQSNNRDKIEILEDHNEAVFSNIAELYGLQKIGWIFTDLIADSSGKGIVKQVRGNVDSHFMTAQECIMAARFQNNYPNKCKLSNSGDFGSKFVTVVVTGDKNKQVHFEGYQVSNQGMSLVKDNCMVPTKDAFELGYIKESSNEQYIPDVFYSSKDKYGNEVNKIARPLPIEYLLVDISVGFPLQETFLFSHHDTNRIFNVENRMVNMQNFNEFSRYMKQYKDHELMTSLNDIHILYFLSVDNMLPLSNEVVTMIKFIVERNNEALMKWSERSENWQTICQLLISNDGIQTLNSSEVVDFWCCNHCTFQNTTSENCEMCNLPKS